MSYSWEPHIWLWSLHQKSSDCSWGSRWSMQLHNTTRKDPGQRRRQVLEPPAHTIWRPGLHLPFTTRLHWSIFRSISSCRRIRRYLSVLDTRLPHRWKFFITSLMTTVPTTNHGFGDTLCCFQQLSLAKQGPERLLWICCFLQGSDNGWATQSARKKGIVQDMDTETPVLETDLSSSPTTSKNLPLQWLGKGQAVKGSQEQPRTKLKLENNNAKRKVWDKHRKEKNLLSLLYVNKEVSLPPG